MSIFGCDVKQYPRIQLLPGGDWYDAISVPFNYTVVIVDPKLQTILRKNKCHAFNENIFLPDSLSISFKILQILGVIFTDATVLVVPGRTTSILLVIKCTMVVKALTYTTIFPEMTMKSFQQAILLSTVHFSNCQFTQQ